MMVGAWHSVWMAYPISKTRFPDFKAGLSFFNALCLPPSSKLVAAVNLRVKCNNKCQESSVVGFLRTDAVVSGSNALSANVSLRVRRVISSL